MKKEEVEIIDETVKQAIGIASDKRYKGGNMTGAISAIEKLKKGLSDHPQVKAVLKRQNEEVEQVEEASETSIDAYYAKRHDNITKKFSAGHQALLKKHTAGAAALDKRKKERGTGTVDHKTGKVSYANEQNEKVELTFEEMTPQQKADRLRLIAKKADYVQSGSAAKAVRKTAKSDMNQKGAQKGMASTKKDVVYDKGDKRGVEENIQQLRKAITEGTTFEKITAYKELNKLIQEKLKREEFILEEDDLFVVIDEEITTGYSPDMGHSGTQGTVNLGGKEHNARKVPIKHYDEFKKKHPGSKVMFRGPRDGMGKEMHTRKSNAHHFYIVHKAKMKEEVELNTIIKQFKSTGEL